MKIKTIIITYLIYVKKTSKKISSLATATPSITFDKRKLVINAFFTSHVSCCSLLQMCHSSKINRKINILHERCSSIIQNDKQSSVNVLLSRYSYVSIHIRNIKKLAFEILRFYNRLSPSMDNVFQLKTEDQYNFLQVSKFCRLFIKIVYDRIAYDNFLFLRTKIWNILPGKLRNMEIYKIFRGKLEPGSLIIVHVVYIRFILKA